MLGEQNGLAILEDGRPDDRPDLSERAACKSSHTRKRRGGRGHHQQCEGVSSIFRLKIAYQGELILRGEADHPDIRILRRINEQIEDVDARYKNPRNLCSGSVRQLNNEITAQKKCAVFMRLALVKADGH